MPAVADKFMRCLVFSRMLAIGLAKFACFDFAGQLARVLLIKYVCRASLLKKGPSLELI